VKERQRERERYQESLYSRECALFPNSLKRWERRDVDTRVEGLRKQESRGLLLVAMLLIRSP